MDYEAIITALSTMNPWWTSGVVPTWAAPVTERRELRRLLRLLEGDRVKMCLIGKKNRLYTAADFEREWGVKPSFWPSVKAIAGCSGDNVRGIVGVGERTAVKFLKCELKDSSKKYRDIVEGTDTVRTNWPLVKLPYVKMVEEEDLPELREDRLTWQKCSAVFRQYGFESLLTGGWREVFNL